MAPLVVDPCGYLKPHHSVGHCPRLHIRHAAVTAISIPKCPTEPPRNPQRLPPGRSDFLSVVPRFGPLLS